MCQKLFKGVLPIRGLIRGRKRIGRLKTPEEDPKEPEESEEEEKEETAEEGDMP